MHVCLKSTCIPTLLLPEQTSRGGEKSQSPRLPLPLLWPLKSWKTRGTNDPHSDGNGPGKKSHLGAPCASSFGGRGATTCHSPGPCLPFHVLLSTAIPGAQRSVFRAGQGVTHWELVRNCAGRLGSCVSLGVPSPSEWLLGFTLQRCPGTTGLRWQSSQSLRLPHRRDTLTQGWAFACKIKGKFLL